MLEGTGCCKSQGKGVEHATETEGPEILDNFAAKRMKSESVPPKRNSSDTVRRQKVG